MALTLETPAGRIKVDADSAVIGRDKTCQVPFPDEQAVQPIHATIKKIAGRWLIEAQGDWLIQVGTGAPGRMNWLQPGDMISLSPTGPELIFEPIVPKIETGNVQVAAGGEWRVPAAATESKIENRIAIPALSQPEPRIEVMPVRSEPATHNLIGAEVGSQKVLAEEPVIHNKVDDRAVGQAADPVGATIHVYVESNANERMPVPEEPVPDEVVEGRQPIPLFGVLLLVIQLSALVGFAWFAWSYKQSSDDRLRVAAYVCMSGATVTAVSLLIQALMRLKR